MRWRLVAVLWLTVLPLAGGCDRPTPPAAERAVLATAADSDPKAEGDALLARRDYAGAVRSYEAALLKGFDGVPLRFALGTALSHLDRPEETRRHFRWIVLHGDPDSREVRAARQWLEDARARHDGDQQGTDAETRVPTSTVRGKTEWPGVDPRERLLPLRIVLEQETNPAVKFSRRFRLGEPYAFKNVPPGTYRLIGKLDDLGLWELTVTVEPGKDAVVDLTNANSNVAPDLILLR
jgi:hypothetical protein